MSPVTHTAPCSWPSHVRPKPMTAPTSAWAPTGPCRPGVAVTVSVGRSGWVSVVVSHGRRPWAGAPSRRAPGTVVSTVGTPASIARPASSRLSAWWSWLSSTASTSPTSSTDSAGPAVLRDDVPQPNA